MPLNNFVSEQIPNSRNNFLGEKIKELMMTKLSSGMTLYELL